MSFLGFKGSYVGFLSTKKVLRILGTLVFSFIFFVLASQISGYLWKCTHFFWGKKRNVSASLLIRNLFSCMPFVSQHPLQCLEHLHHLFPLSARRSQSLLFTHCHLFPGLHPWGWAAATCALHWPYRGLFLSELAQTFCLYGRSCSHRTLAASCQQLCFHTPKQTQCLVLILSRTDFVVLVRWAVSAAIWVTPWEAQGVLSPCRKPATVPFSHLLIYLPHPLAVLNGGDTTGQVSVEDIHVLLLLEWLWTDLSQEFLGLVQFNKSCLWWWMWVTCKSAIRYCWIFLISATVARSIWRVPLICNRQST